MTLTAINMEMSDVPSKDTLGKVCTINTQSVCTTALTDQLLLFPVFGFHKSCNQGRISGYQDVQANLSLSYSHILCRTFLRDVTQNVKHLFT